MSNWQNRLSHSEEVDPRTLIPHAGNFRTHPIGQREVIRAVLETIGWVDDILVSLRTKTILNGHLRVEEAIASEQATVPVRYADLTPDEETLVLATFDRVTALAVVDTERLAELLATVSTDAAPIKALLADYAAEFGIAAAELAETESQDAGDGAAEKDTINVTVGMYRQAIAMPRYREFIRRLVVELGVDDEDTIKAELKRRLGFDDAA